MSMRLGGFLVLLALLVSGCGGGTGPAGRSDSTIPTVDELLEEFSPSRALLEDIQFVADEEGWTMAEALNRLAWQGDFSMYAQELRETYPHQFAGAAILGENGPRSVFVAFRAGVPTEVRENPRLDHLDVDFREMLGFTEEELFQQVRAAHDAMLDAGFPDVGTGPDIGAGLVEVEAVRRKTDRGKSDHEIIADLPPVVRADNVRIFLYDELPSSDDHLMEEAIVVP